MKTLGTVNQIFHIQCKKSFSNVSENPSLSNVIQYFWDELHRRGVEIRHAQKEHEAGVVTIRAKASLRYELRVHSFGDGIKAEITEVRSKVFEN